MRRAQAKIKSQRGATLMLALLLFLVCAVLGSVVLMAGTAAAGRLSQLSRMEQRYYAVTSAANLLREKLCTEDGVEVVCKKVSVSGSDTPGYTLLSATAPAGEAFLVRLSRVAMFKDSSLLSESLSSDIALSDVNQWNTFIGDVSSATVPEFSLDLEVEGHDKLDVTVAVSVNPDRTMLLKVSNKTAAEKDDKYTLNMTLTPELSRSRSTTTSTAVSGTTETVTTTETQTAKLKWVVSTIQTEGG